MTRSTFTSNYGPYAGVMSVTTGLDMYISDCQFTGNFGEVRTGGFLIGT